MKQLHNGSAGRKDVAQRGRRSMIVGTKPLRPLLRGEGALSVHLSVSLTHMDE